MRFVSSCLEGRNANKVFSIWSGSGDNGKTVMVSLIEQAFGDYAVKMPTSLLMGFSVNTSCKKPLCTIGTIDTAKGRILSCTYGAGAFAKVIKVMSLVNSFSGCLIKK